MSNAWDDPRIRRGMTEQLAKRRARIAGGEAPLGWKVGFGAPAAMEKLKIGAPLVGFLMQRALVASGGTASLAGWIKPVAEPEIAVHVGRDLAGGGDRAAAAAAIAALGPAIELADADLPFEDPEAILKGNIFQRHVLLGPVSEGADPAEAKLTVLVDGEEVATADDVTAATGDLDGLVKHVAKTLKAAGAELQRGDMVICGSIVPALDIAPGATVEVRLPPLGSLVVNFE